MGGKTMNRATKSSQTITRVTFFFLAIAVCFTANVFGLTIKVVDPAGFQIPNFRWLLEEDNTHLITPGVVDPTSLSFSIHNSCAPVIAAGTEANATVDVDPSVRYVVSVLPDADYSNGGGLVAAGQTEITICVNKNPLPTAQISVLVFHDHAPLNNQPDMAKFGVGGAEEGLEGFSVVLHDAAGQVMMDAFANPLGTTYQMSGGEHVLDLEGNPVVDVMGDSVILTDANGEASIKNVAPNKYGIIVVPPAGQGWLQTSTIEGTPVVDAWVKAGEPKYLIEFGPPLPHVFYGFTKLKPLDNPGLPSDPNVATVTGRAVKQHTDPANAFIGVPGPPVPNCFVGLNQMGGISQEYLYAAACDPDTGEFTIPNVPAGLYQIVFWDMYMDVIFTFHTLEVPQLTSDVAMGDILTPQWFGELEGYIFNDLDRNGFMDVGETGIGLEDVLLRLRDGTIYQITSTDPFGFYQFSEVFPFFHWIVAEVGFARYFATGMTAVVDAGGDIPPDNGWFMPSDDKRNPQPQAQNNPFTPDNNNLSRTETATFSGEVLLEAMQVFADQSNRIDWGKDVYTGTENGGIAGIVYYATTRAEDDPRWAAAEGWEPGIGRIQLALYQDINGDGVIDDLNNDGVPTVADVDNYPFGWTDGGAMGPEDEKRNGMGTVFDPGDAIQIATTDCWDDNIPDGCMPPGTNCAEGQQTWNQIRPGVFDGGYAIVSYHPGGIASGSAEVEGLPAGAYIIEAAAPSGLEHVKEEDKNVDFGDTWVPNPDLTPPISVGDPHLVPAELTLFPGIPAPFAGQLRPLPDRKQVIVSDGFNAAAEFFMFSYAPRSARCVGLITDDLTIAFDPTSPNFGEKFAPPWVPVAFRDYLGKEVVRVYGDQFGAYNALIPSTYSVNLPTPTGVSPQMHTICINDPGPVEDPYHPGRMILDPHFKSQWAPQCYVLDFWPGKITYADTPVIPVGAFVGENKFPLDCEFPDETPLIYMVSGPEGGPYVSTVGQTITIESLGITQVPNHEFDPAVPGSQTHILRDYGFGTTPGTVTAGCYKLTNVIWGDDIITATVPVGVPESSQLVVTRGDNQKHSPVGVTLTVGGAKQVIHVRSGQSIQSAIDIASSGALILVDPGVYEEMVIVWKNVRLQGSGEPSTIIDALAFFPNTKLETWRTKIAQLVNDELIDLLPDQDQALTFEEGAGVTVVAKIGEFGPEKPTARIDGFNITGSTTGGGGVFVNAYAGNLKISNNRIESNLGNIGGGIRIGHRATAEDTHNDYIQIDHNHIVTNSGLNAGGGISLFKGTDNYEIKYNFICGNFTNSFGGGISHDGLSEDGLIAHNCITFNEAFIDRANIGGTGGGIAIIGERVLGAVSPGTGSVEITGNTLQGNLARSGDGGAISLIFVNGQDAAASPLDSTGWYTIDILNNLIVNNVTALAGAISLQDALKVNIINCTIANNDSTATASDAFQAGSTVSTPQPAGIAGRGNSIALGAIGDILFSDPVIHDCIIHGNRVFNYDPALIPTEGDGLQRYTPMPFWDLGVLPESLNENLDPKYCLLTDATGFDPTNIDGDPQFVDPYDNLLQTAAEPTEGGNFIDITFRPLSKIGDYHIGEGSAAIGTGGGVFLPTYVQLRRDIDRDRRPFPSAGDPDIGADERTEDELIIDNLDAGATPDGDWLISGGANPWVDDSVYSKKAGETFTFEGLRLSTNDVFIWYTAWSSRSSAVQVEIFDGLDLLDTLKVNQRTNTSQWYRLGRYTFTGIAKVVITATGSTSTTNADAVRFVPVAPPQLCGITIIGPDEVEEDTSTDYDLRAIYTDGTTSTVNADQWDVVDTGATINSVGLLTVPPLSQHGYLTIKADLTDEDIVKHDEKTVFAIDLDSPREIIVDNLDAETSQTGTWIVSGGANPWGLDSVYSRANGDTFTFHADLVNVPYAVFARWTAWSSRRSSVPIRITSGVLDDIVTVNQKLNPSMWNLLGIYTLGANTEVTIRSLGGGSTNADAVRFVPVSMLTELVMDNDNPVATRSGSWSTSSGMNPYGSRSIWSKGVGDTVTYTVPWPGTFNIQGWWTEWPSRSTSVPIEIYDGATPLTTFNADQQVDGGMWNTIATGQTFANSVRIVVRSTSTSDSTNADAFRLIPVP